jgi:SAM-dependent methyltransferase
MAPDAPTPLQLNLGCGPDVQKTGWTDIDGSWNLRVQSSWWGRMLAGYIARRSGFRWPLHVKWLDITEGLPFSSGTVDAVYASHVLEHLYRHDALRLLKECKRVLKPNGVIRLVLPDLRSMTADYLHDDRADAAIRFNEALLMREQNAPPGLLNKLKRSWADHHSHKFMYDAPLLIRDLKQAGFREPVECGYLESLIPSIGEVERSGRVLNGAGFIVEARN